MTLTKLSKLAGLGGRALAIGAVGLAAGFASGNIAAADTPKKGGTLVVGLETDLLGFNPLKANVMSVTESTVAVTLMERGGEFDNDGNTRQVLLQDAKRSDDGKTWTYKIRKGVKWHDGSDFTADDYVNYYKFLLNPKNRYFGLLFMVHLKDVVKVDEETVQVAVCANVILEVTNNDTFNEDVLSIERSCCTTTLDFMNFDQCGAGGTATTVRLTRCAIWR